MPKASQISSKHSASTEPSVVDKSPHASVESIQDPTLACIGDFSDAVFANPLR